MEIIGIPWYGVLIISALTISLFIIIFKYGLLKIDKDYYQDIVILAIQKEKTVKRISKCNENLLELQKQETEHYKRISELAIAWLKQMGCLE